MKDAATFSPLFAVAAHASFSVIQLAHHQNPSPPLPTAVDAFAEKGYHDTDRTRGERIRVLLNSNKKSPQFIAEVGKALLYQAKQASDRWIVERNIRRRCRKGEKKEKEMSSDFCKYGEGREFTVKFAGNLKG